MRRDIFALALLSTMAFVIASCSSSSNPSSVAEDPTVEATSPADGAVDVGLVRPVVIEFSEPLDEATVNDSTLVVEARGLTGYVEYDDSAHTVSFVPDTLYAENSWFDVTVSGEVEDIDGNPLGQDMTFSFETGALDCAHLEDYMEPNDSPAGARRVEMGRVYHTLTGCDDDSDFFEIALDDTVKLLPLASFRRADEVCYLYVRRAAGDDYSFTGSHMDPGDNLGSSFTLMPGTYYVEVTSDAGGYDDWTLYDFSYSTTDPCTDDDYEDNDFFDEAAPITPGLHEDLRGCRVDRDYYSVYAEEGQTITLTTDVQEGSTAMQWYAIYGPSESQMAFYAGVDDPVTIDAVATTSGTHYLMVRYWSDGMVYDMDVSVE